jgi:hypothetical protein
MILSGPLSAIYATDPYGGALQLGRSDLGGLRVEIAPPRAEAA